LGSSTLFKNNLHVQSISEWAPACIGPYAQGVKLRTDEGCSSSISVLAGQISLDPASMVLDQSKDI